MTFLFFILTLLKNTLNLDLNWSEKKYSNGFQYCTMHTAN